MKRRKTIQQIADDLNLSRVTISSVLNGNAAKRGFSGKTILRVNNYIEQCGFVPSSSARRLRLGESKSIGILYSGHLDGHLTDAFNRLTNYYVVNGYHMEIFLTPNNEVLNGVRELISRGVGSLIWIHSSAPEVEFADGAPLFKLLQQVETVIYNYQSTEAKWDTLIKEIGINYVGVDRMGGFDTLAAFLKKTGHCDIGISWVEGKNSEYHKILKKHGLNTHWILPDNPFSTKRQWAMDVVGKYIDHPKRKIDAICTLDDSIAGYLMNALIEKGIIIPDDVTITGFDGMEFSEFTRVPLTTLAFPVKQMVEWTIRDNLNSTERECEKLFTPELVLRSSHKLRNREKIK